MDFARVEAEYERLKAQFESGDLTEADFRAKLEELMIEDEQGRWWVIGSKTGQWYVHDGQEWVQQEPPTTTPKAAPVREQRHPKVADLPPGSPDTILVESGLKSAPAARLQHVLRLDLPRDTASLLLIAAGWSVCYLGFSAIMDRVYPYWPLAVVVGGIGGLITGLVLRRTEPRSPWILVPVMTAGWAAAMAIVWWLPAIYTRHPWMLRGAIVGLVGGLITAAGLKWAHSSLGWKQAALVAIGWGVGLAVGGAVAWSLTTLDGRSMVISEIRYVLWGGIGGAIGGWVMFRQLRGGTGSSA